MKTSFYNQRVLFACRLCLLRRVKNFFHDSLFFNFFQYFGHFFREHQAGTWGGWVTGPSHPLRNDQESKDKLLKNKESWKKCETLLNKRSQYAKRTSIFIVSIFYSSVGIFYSVGFFFFFLFWGFGALGCRSFWEGLRWIYVTVTIMVNEASEALTRTSPWTYSIA